jgi:hypothetical protein
VSKYYEFIKVANFTLKNIIIDKQVVRWIVELKISWLTSFNRPLAKVPNTPPPTPSQSIGKRSVYFPQMRGGVLYF